MNRIITLLVLAILLAGCGSGGSKTQTQIIPITRTVTDTVYVNVEVPPDLPDLIASMPYVIGDTLPGPNTFAVSVTNVGTEPAAATALHVRCFRTTSFNTSDEITVLYDGDLGTGGTLAEGGSVTVTFDVTLNEATEWIRVEVTVDSIGTITEANESNNQFNINLLIRAQGVTT